MTPVSRRETATATVVSRVQRPEYDSTGADRAMTPLYRAIRVPVPRSLYATHDENWRLALHNHFPLWL